VGEAAGLSEFRIARAMQDCGRSSVIGFFGANVFLRRRELTDLTPTRRRGTPIVSGFDLVKLGYRPFSGFSERDTSCFKERCVVPCWPWWVFL